MFDHVFCEDVVEAAVRYREGLRGIHREDAFGCQKVAGKPPMLGSYLPSDFKTVGPLARKVGSQKMTR
jgi:hypothetical protein